MCHHRVGARLRRAPAAPAPAGPHAAWSPGGCCTPAGSRGQLQQRIVTGAGLRRWGQAQVVVAAERTVPAAHIQHTGCGPVRAPCMQPAHAVADVWQCLMHSRAWRRLRPGLHPRARTHGAAGRACSCAAAPDDCGDPGCEAPAHSRSGFTQAPSSSSSPARTPPAGGASGAALPGAGSPAASSSSWGAGASALPDADVLCGVAAAGLTGAAGAAVGGPGAGASCAAGGGTPVPARGRPEASPAASPAAAARAAHSVCCAASHAASARLSTCSGRMAPEAGGGASGTRRLSSCGEAHADALLPALAGVFCAHARRRAGQHRALGACPQAAVRLVRTPCWLSTSGRCQRGRALERGRQGGEVMLAPSLGAGARSPWHCATRARRWPSAWRAAAPATRESRDGATGPVHFFQTLASNALPAEHRTGWGVSDSPQSTST
jgi:hypothetical protein